MAERSPSSSLLSLPPELLHRILAKLPTPDLHASRRSCSLLASIGLDYINDEVSLIYHMESFAALKRITKHPRHAKRVRSLFYVLDRCKHVSFDQWDAARADPRREDAEEDLVLQTAGKEHYRIRIADIPEDDRQAAYRAFLDLHRNQWNICMMEIDLACLRTLFAQCEYLREVTIASHVACKRRLPIEQKIEAQAMTILREDWKWETAGIDQVLTVATAAGHAGTKLDSLTLAGISHTLFDKSTERGNLIHHRLTELITPLRRLRLIIQAWQPEMPETENLEGLGLNYMQVNQIFERGYLRRMLVAASELRVLKLSLPEWKPREHTFDFQRLEYVLKKITFPHLYELALSKFEVRASFLTELVLRHKTTLRRLSLSNISLSSNRSSWREVFAPLGGQLPELRQVRLRGWLGVDGEPTINCDLNNRGAGTCAAPYRDALESFILKGGEYPEEDLRYLPQYIENQEGDYVPPCQPDEVEDRKPDDPANDYEWDEFDDGMW